MSWIDIGSADLEDGALREARAGPVRLAVARVGDAYVAFDAWCTHADCPLSEGWLEGAAVRCACHSALFALPTGEVLEGPARSSLTVYDTRVVGGVVQVSVDLPGLDD